MSELGDLLELLHRGGTGDRTVTATVVTWQHAERARAAFTAQVERDDGSFFLAVASSDEPPPEETTTTARLWLAPPDRAREEAGDHVGVRRGRRWWSYDPDQGALSNEDDEEVSSGVGGTYAHLFDSGTLLGALMLEPAGRDTVDGRPALLARAVPRRSASGQDDVDWTLHELGFGADEWRLAVDAEHGVLLRVESLLGGLPFQRVDVLDLVIGEPVDDAVFVFEPPPGEAVRPLDVPRMHHHLSVDQVAARAPFAVFVPERLAAEWTMDVLFAEGGGHNESGPWVQLWLRTEGRHWSAVIRQAAAADAVEREIFVADADPTPWLAERHGDRELFVRRPASEWAAHSVRLTLEGTAIEVLSSDVDADRLAEIAASLVRAPQAPPPLT